MDIAYCTIHCTKTRHIDVVNFCHRHRVTGSLAAWSPGHRQFLDDYRLRSRGHSSKCSTYCTPCYSALGVQLIILCQYG